jgi:hypothetical protein
MVRCLGEWHQDSVLQPRVLQILGETLNGQIEAIDRTDGTSFKRAPF